jgi:phage shock protein A
MGLLSRMANLFRAKISSLFDRAENVGESLDYSYEKQLELLQNVKRGIVDVVTAKRRLELQAAKLQDSVTKLDGQARQALTAGREDLARMALERKQGVQSQMQSLQSQIGDLQKEQEKLTSAEQRLSLKIESFKTRKETIKAQYSAAEASVKIGEAATGISEEMADVGLAIERAEDKTEKMRARSVAIDELVESGTLTDFTGSSDVIDRELAGVTSAQNVNLELEEMKRQLLGAPNSKQLQEGDKQ